MANIGDKVRFLNDVGGGVVARIVGNMAYVVDDDGFENPMPLKECVVVDQVKPKPTAYDRPPVENPQSKLREAQAPKPQLPIVETPHGDTMNVVLAYEPVSVKNLSNTDFHAYLVNDSNYYLYFTYLSREEGKWNCRYSGVVEPNIQVLLEKFSYDSLTELSRIAIQLIAFKKGGEFEIKSPVSVEYRLDTTKFYKLHSFRQNEYFDSPVMAFDIVCNDAPYREMPIDAAKLQEAMLEKDRDNAPLRKKVEKHQRQAEILEVDLHISELVDTTAGMSNADMLNLQLEKFREVMQQNIRRKGAKIVFIHGKGEGVLRKAIIDEIKKKFGQCTAQDASFREYGFGATLVTIH